MLRPELMRRLLIAAPKGQIDAVIATLYKHNAYHIEDFVAESEAAVPVKIGMPRPGASDAASALIKIRAIENACGIDPDEVEIKQKIPAAKVRSIIERDLPALQHEVEELLAKRSRLEANQKESEQRARELEPFAAIPLDMEMYHGYERFSVLVGHIPKDIQIAVPHEKYFSDKVAGNIVVVIVQSSDREAVERTLLDAGFQAVPIPEETGSPQSRIDHYTKEVKQLEGEISDINRRIQDVKDRHGETLVACDELLTADVERAEAPLRFATTEETFVTEGWVPADGVEKVKEELVRAAGGKIYITEMEIENLNDVPVEYQNPSFAKPSQMLMDLYSRPKYTEVDPTLMVSIVFPLFFGLILGDVGYGLILLLLTFGLRKFFKAGEGRQLLISLRNASIASIGFGILFSEFFGFALPWEPIIYSRHLNIGGHASEHGAQVAELLIVSIWIGILHISLGRVLGIVNARKMYHGKHATKAMLANAGWLGTMWGILLMIWSLYAIPLMPDLTGLPMIAMGLNLAAVIGVVLLLGGIVAIAQENALEVVEIPTIISHVLSYARLTAVGLSSVAIALVINYIAIGMMIEPQLEEITVVGVLIIIVGILVFLLGHALNTALGILGGGLNSIRLHYVEFFTKFYKGGGKKYDPFGMEQKFTEE
ncbi:V-type ATP synthase subunit I [Methanoculleus sp. FWC-SCC1]|uniref:A-type ATP synthase subunit I n=1 Tax=Methanoculleus frigidifontis TaxID=2584085 RepID=A0ABT8M9S6_9EURY|nr:V-type ATP synthase subunit I [Methanoculleus sp. FWC-SCC1]MDN7024685.1 V-type ATP synthase subunit I [Methanoculleus sp. FWC-SCC1]